MTPRSFGLALALLGLALGSARADDGAAAWRLFVSDHAEPVLSVIDAEAGAVIETLPLSAPASLYAGETGRTVYAVQGRAGRVTAIASGIAVEDHGDHADLVLSPPRLTGFEVEGENPVHFVEHGGVWAAFFDDEGLARLFSDAEALSGEAGLRTVDAGVPHHGVVVPFGAHDLVSVPHPEDPTNLPVGIAALDRDGNRVGEIAPCPELHGEAKSGTLVAFACETGLLVASAGGSAPRITHLPYAETLPEGKATTLLGGRGLQYFLGNYGASGLVLIDPTEADAFRHLALPARRVHFTVDPVRPRFAYVATEDGQLHRLDVIAGTILESLSLTEPYSMDGHWSDPRPRIAVAGEAIYLTDPREGRVLRVDAETFVPEGEIAVGGAPFNIIAIGGSGRTH
ncbi:hypothetical protein EMQ25_11165 [Arsenicitalea aurantiaca]|uniref:YncE family protein n=1 Tax=Arsenicitalea aurantiaca TaxID=1783274 RepID=A0A433XBC7_9HYPH|nr:metallochaperone AztD [Arsenicitalea aurantiaca]RUT31401.1 hypothetical protein EMQ25_11165 [Arsenicitalea aurantiaca]